MSTGVSPISFPFMIISFLAASGSFGIIPSRIASLIAFLIIPTSLPGLIPKVLMISLPSTGG